VVINGYPGAIAGQISEELDQDHAGGAGGFGGGRNLSGTGESVKKLNTRRSNVSGFSVDPDSSISKSTASLFREPPIMRAANSTQKLNKFGFTNEAWKAAKDEVRTILG